MVRAILWLLTRQNKAVLVDSAEVEKSYIPDSTTNRDQQVA